MSSIKLVGSTSGEITISAPAVAGTNTLTLPASTGTIITDDGTGKIDASGGGIYLGGTASANLLDDYETGDYTPSLEQGGNAMTVAGATGHYVKIGHLVWATWLITNITKTGTGDLRISLPFIVDGHGYGAAQVSRLTFATNDRDTIWIALNNTSKAALYFNQNGNANSNAVIASDLADASNSDLYGTVMYRTD